MIFPPLIPAWWRWFTYVDYLYWCAGIEPLQASLHTTLPTGR